LTADPGTAHAHGSVGTSLLGHALARKAGTNLESLLVERICGPLKMDSTRFTLTPELKARVALEHNPFGYAKPMMDWGALEPAAGLNSTANDLLKFVSAFGLTPFRLTPLMEKWPLQACCGGFSLGGIKVQSTQMEEDVRLETLFVPIPKGLFDQPLDFIV
jgi:CubicO group peptidase (beta-lactamase class C family)